MEYLKLKEIEFLFISIFFIYLHYIFNINILFPIYIFYIILFILYYFIIIIYYFIIIILIIY